MVLTGNAEAAPPPPYGKVVGVGSRRILVVRPNPRRFGRQGVEILCSLAYARAAELPVCFIWPAEVASEALLEVTTPDVRVLTPRREGMIGGAVIAVADAVDGAEALKQRAVDTARYEMMSEMRRRLGKPRRVPPAARTRIKARREILKKQVAGSKSKTTPGSGFHVSNEERRLLADPVSTTLTPRAERRALELAAGFGLDPDNPMVCLYVPEREYKPRSKIPDRKPGGWDDSLRNARIETCLPAVDHLVERGYTVVRMGDPTMTPVTREGLVDLATSPKRDPLLELWCQFRSKFLVAGESGPLLVSYLTNTPALTINATDPIGAFPIRSDGLYMLKEIVDRETDQPLSPSELVTEDHQRHLRNPERHRFVENPPHQIVEAVEEMLELLGQHPSESPGQSWYRQLVTYAAERFGQPRAYVGRGRVVRLQADPWFETDAPGSPIRVPPAIPPR